MKITVDEKTYTAIKNLSFAPETDVTGSELPINGFSADVMTSDEIGVGGTASLYDDRDKLWAKYWLIEAQRKDLQTVHVEAQSVLRILDRTTMDARMYSGESISTVLPAIFGSLPYTLDPAFSGASVSGYCPEQSARERLQWICFCVGAYVKTFFNDRIEILPIDDSMALVPTGKTFWKPSITYGDYVTAVKARAYTYTEGTPQTTDKWVEVNGTYYIQTEQDFTLSNPDVPDTANENVVSVEGITIIGHGNVSAVLSLLSNYYFRRMEVDADVINNADYVPGEKITISCDDTTMITGYIKSADFSFGLQARSKVKLVQTDITDGAALTIISLYGGDEIWRQTYNLPVGYEYDIENPYIDLTKSKTRFIYRPLSASATGTVQSDGTTDEEEYDIALRFKSGVLKVFSVDEVEQNNDIVRIT